MSAPAGGTGGLGPDRKAWSAEDYGAHARFVSDLGTPVLSLLAPQAGEWVLDLGCGDGALSAEIAAAGAEVIGVDAAPDMVAAARARGLDAREGDAAALPFAQEFDAVFSNAALHWMTEPDPVIAGVARALRPGGRFVGEFGGMGNVAAIHTAIIAVLDRHGVEDDLSRVWYFPTEVEYGAKLRSHGFEVDQTALIPRPTMLTSGMAAWLSTLAAPLLAALPADQRDAVISETVALLRPALCDGAGNWRADYVRLRFSARLGVRP